MTHSLWGTQNGEMAKWQNGEMAKWRTVKKTKRRNDELSKRRKGEKAKRRNDETKKRRNGEMIIFFPLKSAYVSLFCLHYSDREINLEKLRKIIIRGIHTSNNYTFKRRLSIVSCASAEERDTDVVNVRIEDLSNNKFSVTPYAKPSLLSRTFE